jgi:DNA-binding NarL/FixJ family response regulator
VFLVDDHEVARRGIRSLIEEEPDIEVVGEAATAGEAVGRILATSPDVALVDVLLPDGDGVTVCREVRSRRPEIRVLMLTSFSDDEALFDSILAGASGYVLKQVRGFDLVDAVRRLAAGQSLLDPAVTGAALERLRERVDARRTLLPDINGRDLRILELIAEGCTNRQIGEQVHLAEKTVKNHVSALLRQLGLHRRTEAAVLVARQNAGRVPSYAPTAE